MSEIGGCPYCAIQHPDSKVLFEDELVRFIQDERYQGALKHSGIIIPVERPSST